MKIVDTSFKVCSRRFWYSVSLAASYSIVLLLNLHTESKILTFGNKNGGPDMVTRKILKEKFI